MGADVCAGVVLMRRTTVASGPATWPVGGPFGPRVATELREDPTASHGTTLAHVARVTSTKRKTPPKQARKPKPPPPKVWRWDEVLDAAMSLSEDDFTAVLCDMMMVRYQQDQRRIRRYISRYGVDEIAFDDPLEDDFADVPFDTDPAVVPLTPRRARARKR